MDTMLDSPDVQAQFAGYYYDGKATPEAVKQIEHIMITKG
jgi:hypothetical protein